MRPNILYNVIMSTKELILNEIDELNEQELQWLYQLIQRIQEKKPEQGFLKRLSQIEIEGPVDFAKNLDLYLSGEKQIATDLP